MQYFYKHTFHQKKPVLTIEEELNQIIKRMSAKAVADIPDDEHS